MAAETLVGTLAVRIQLAYDRPVTVSGNQQGLREGVHVFWHLRSGGVRMTTPGIDRLVTAPACVALPPWVRRDQRFIPGTCLLSVRFFANDAVAGRPWPGFAATVWPGEGPAGLLAAGEALVRAVRSGGPLEGIRAGAATAGFAAAWSEALAELGHLPSAGSAADPAMDRVRQALAAHGRIRPVPWDAVCAAAELSRPQVDRRFRAAYGCSPAAWLDRLALERITVALADPDRPLRTIARDHGFADDAHLARWHRRMTGGSPRHRGAAGA